MHPRQINSKNDRRAATAVEPTTKSSLFEVPLKLPDGRDRVVRHGHGPQRAIQIGVGPVGVRRAKVRDRGDVGTEEKICSPLWIRHPEPSGSRWATPPLIQQRSGQSLRRKRYLQIATGLADGVFPFSGLPPSNLREMYYGQGRKWCLSGTESPRRLWRKPPLCPCISDHPAGLGCWNYFPV
jgi:hypothetical protein